MQEISPNYQVQVSLLISDATDASDGVYILKAANVNGAYNITRFEVNVPAVKTGELMSMRPQMRHVLPLPAPLPFAFKTLELQNHLLESITISVQSR